METRIAQSYGEGPVILHGCLTIKALQLEP